MSYLKKGKKKKTKTIKIGIGIPTPERVHPDFAIYNLTEILNYTRKNLPNAEVYVRAEQGVRTDRNRNVILKEFLEEGMDYVLWLDADMIYPADIIERYLKDTNYDLDVMGCLYFQRTPPHKPIGYVSEQESGKFRPMLPQFCHPGNIYNVAGLGYGGMMVSTKVYEKLGDKKWTRYGENFHIPWAETGNLTHDLVFCKDVKEKDLRIQLHGSVRPLHIGEKAVGVDQYWEQDNVVMTKYPKVLVIMPTTNAQLAHKAAQLMKKRAGMPCEVLVVVDEQEAGFIQVVNDMFKDKQDYHFYVYTAQDAFVGKDWLLRAVMKQAKTGAGLIGFNDGKWDGALASFGMVERKWALSNYDGDMFYPEYKSHYADTELTQIAKDQGRYAYCEDSLMVEIDYKKDFGGTAVNSDDKKLYNQRKHEVISKKELQEMFS